MPLPHVPRPPTPPHSTPATGPRQKPADALSGTEQPVRDLARLMRDPRYLDGSDPSLVAHVARQFEKVYGPHAERADATGRRAVPMPSGVPVEPLPAALASDGRGLLRQQSSMRPDLSSEVSSEASGPSDRADPQQANVWSDSRGAGAYSDPRLRRAQEAAAHLNRYREEHGDDAAQRALQGMSSLTGKPPFRSPLLIGPVDALAHYMVGLREPAFYDFGNVDISGIRPSDFEAVRKALLQRPPGTTSIKTSKRFSTTNFGAANTVGWIRLNLVGELTVKAGGDYEFDGTVSAQPDLYDFNESNHRTEDAELKTEFGRQIPGKEFPIVIQGSQPIRQKSNLFNILEHFDPIE